MIQTQGCTGRGTRLEASVGFGCHFHLEDRLMLRAGLRGPLAFILQAFLGTLSVPGQGQQRVSPSSDLEKALMMGYAG